ncbi:MAG: alkaline phosphatase PhoX, partial [Planctomycetaceae bacterium]
MTKHQDGDGSGLFRSTDRREFLRSTAAAVGSFAVPGAFDALLARARAGEKRPSRSIDYGPLHPATDENTGWDLLQLPEGFRYLSFGWTGDAMSDGTITPGSHDGMAVIAEDEETGIVTLCRNHEIRTLPDRRAFGPEEITYDERAGGGCVQLRFDTRNGRWLDARSSLSGTCRNCAGGPTPWGSWLTCEETVSDSQWDSEAGRGEHRPYAKTHGWIFEVPADRPAEAVPLKDMGRFIHEAVAVDPDTGSVYETEDRTTAGFYRFLQKTGTKISDGGRLQMLKVLGRDQVQTGLRAGETFDVEWVDIDDPERPHHDDRKHETLGVFMQGQAKGGATFARLEGCWYGNGVV